MKKIKTSQIKLHPNTLFKRLLRATLLLLSYLDTSMADTLVSRPLDTYLLLLRYRAI